MTGEHEVDEGLAGIAAGGGGDAQGPPTQLRLADILAGASYGEPAHALADHQEPVDQQPVDTEPLDFQPVDRQPGDFPPVGFPPADTAPVVAGAGLGADMGFGWLGGPVGPAGLPDSLRPAPPADDFGDEAALVRPYAWTRGRTRANYDLKLETLVSSNDQPGERALASQVEHREVSALCRYPLSVAEVAAKLSIPLGVARVILSDMAELGLISIHRTFADDDSTAHLVLMERVLSGLRRL